MISARRFEGRAALIAGGASGIGRGAAIRLAQEGAAVAIADINAETGGETCRQVEAMGGSALFVLADVTEELDCRRMVEETVRELGRLDVLVNSTGVPTGGGTVVDTTLEHWNKLLDVDLKAVYLASRFAVPEMVKVGGGAIVNVSSIGGLRGSLTGMAFQAAKGGVINLTRHMAIAHAAQHIRVNCICPGVIDTPLVERWLSDPQEYKRACALHPMNRIGKPEETAAAIAFLASDEASFITGAVLPVDGGFLAKGP
jgi:NAD(P)-dependent dehydrogenase (short-subunit alcohol dehydrogenase family)